MYLVSQIELFFSMFRNIAHKTMRSVEKVKRKSRQRLESNNSIFNIAHT